MLGALGLLAWRVSLPGAVEQAAPGSVRATPARALGQNYACVGTIESAASRLTPAATIGAIAASLSAPIVDTHSVVEARVYDCDQRPASGVRLEVWYAHADGYRSCRECRIAYPGPNGAPEPTQTQFAPRADAPAWMVVAPRNVLFIAREVDTGRPVSALGPVKAQPGAMRLVLTPASAAQLAALPADVR